MSSEHVQSIGSLELVAGFHWSTWLPSRLYPDGPELEFITPKGGTLLVPGATCGELRMAGVRFGAHRALRLLPWLQQRRSYTIDDCRYVGPVGALRLDQWYTGNLITNEGLTAVAKMMVDFSAAYNDGFGAVEVGTGGGSPITPEVEDVALVGGAVRKAIATKGQSSSEITVTASLTSGTTAIYIREAGIYIATTDTATLSAGDLFDHSAEDFDNSGTPVNLTFTWVCSAQRKSS